MEVARTQNHCQNEQDANTRVNRESDCPVEYGLAQGAYGGQGISDKIKFPELPQRSVIAHTGWACGRAHLGRLWRDTADQT